MMVQHEIPQQAGVTGELGKRVLSLVGVERAAVANGRVYISDHPSKAPCKPIGTVEQVRQKLDRAGL